MPYLGGKRLSCSGAVIGEALLMKQISVTWGKWRERAEASSNHAVWACGAKTSAGVNWHGVTAVHQGRMRPASLPTAPLLITPNFLL